MADAPTRPNGAAAWRPSLPTALVIASMVVAVIAVSGLLFLLYTRTTGPGEVLRDFFEEVAAGDCQGSHELLHTTVRIDLDTWCEQLPALSDQIDPDFAVQRVVLEEEIAQVRLRNPDGSEAVWRLQRFDRSWLVLGPLSGAEFPV